MATDPHRFDWALVRSFLAVLDAGSLMGAARTARRAAAHAEPARGRAGGAARRAAVRAHRPRRHAHRRGAGHRRRGAADGGRRRRAGAQLAGRRDATTGTVRITTSQVAASYLLPPVLAALQREEPGIQVELVASNQLSNLLRREADIAVRMVRPAQSSLVARKLADIAIVAGAHAATCSAPARRASPPDLLQHRLIGYDRDDTIERGFARAGHAAAARGLRAAHRRPGGLRPAGRRRCRHRLRRALQPAHWPGVVPLLPMLQIPPLPCWLAVHREIRGSRWCGASTTSWPRRFRASWQRTALT